MVIRRSSAQREVRGKAQLIVCRMRCAPHLLIWFVWPLWVDIHGRPVRAVALCAHLVDLQRADGRAAFDVFLGHGPTCTGSWFTQSFLEHTGDRRMSPKTEAFKHFALRWPALLFSRA